MNLYLAPLQGMTIACYRNAFARIFGGIDGYYSPFVATADNEKISRALLKDLLPEYNKEQQKVIPQLLGNSGEAFRRFAGAIYEMGYTEINWNIGCPFPMVTNKKKGAGILPYPQMVESFLNTVCEKMPYSLTVKMRLGMNSAEEGLRVMEILNQYPLGGVIIHARTGVQMYSGTVDLEGFSALAAACRHKVTYNGDIFTTGDFNSISERLPAVENFMLGRGALRDPFLPRAIRGTPISPDLKGHMFREFHEEILQYYQAALSGEKHVCDKMKEFWSYVRVHTDRDGKLMKKIKKCHGLNSYLEIVNQVLSSPTCWSDTPLQQE